MVKELRHFLEVMRPAFSRQATYGWFIVIFIGFLLREDSLGVSSIVRALCGSAGTGLRQVLRHPTADAAAVGPN